MNTDHLVTQSQYARHRGVTEAAVSKWVKAGRFPVHPYNGKKLIDPAEADFALDQSRARLDEPRQLAAMPIDDLSPPAAGEELPADDDGGEDEAPPPAPASDTLTKERTRETHYRAKMAELAYRQRVGELVPRAGLIEAAQKCAHILVHAIDDLVAHADDLVAAAAKDGAGGMRLRLRALARELRERAASALVDLEKDAAAAGAADETEDV